MQVRSPQLVPGWHGAAQGVLGWRRGYRLPCPSRRRSDHHHCWSGEERFTHSLSDIAVLWCHCCLRWQWMTRLGGCLTVVLLQLTILAERFATCYGVPKRSGGHQGDQFKSANGTAVNMSGKAEVGVLALEMSSRELFQLQLPLDTTWWNLSQLCFTRHTSWWLFASSKATSWFHCKNGFSACIFMGIQGSKLPIPPFRGKKVPIKPYEVNKPLNTALFLGRWWHGGTCLTLDSHDILLTSCANWMEFTRIRWYGAITCLLFRPMAKPTKLLGGTYLVGKIEFCLPYPTEV